MKYVIAHLYDDYGHYLVGMVSDDLINEYSYYPTYGTYESALEVVRIKLNDNDIRSKVCYDHGHRDYKPRRLPYSQFLKEVFKDDLIALNYDGWIEGA